MVQRRRLRFRYMSVLRRDFQTHCLLRKSVRSSMMVHNRLGSAHCHSCYKEQRGSSGSKLVPQSSVLTCGPWSSISVTWEPGRNVPRPAESESLGMGLIMGVRTSPAGDSDLIKVRSPSSEKRELCAPGDTQGSSLQLWVQLRALTESSQQPRKPGSVINPILLVKNSTHSHRGSERQRQGLSTSCYCSAAFTPSQTHWSSLRPDGRGTSKTEVSSSQLSFLFPQSGSNQFKIQHGLLRLDKNRDEFSIKK